MVSLADVLARPDDDEVRLAYSDAIAGTDAALAEFIKLQIVQAQKRREHASPPPDISARAQVLRMGNIERWAAPMLKLVESGSFLRGLMEVVTVDAAKFLVSADRIYATAPVLHVNFTNAGPVAKQLFASPALARLKSIELRDNELGDAGAIALANSPHLESLRWLGLRNNGIGQAGLDALAERLDQVGYVNFESNPAGDPTVHFVDYSSETEMGKALQAKYGPRKWLAIPKREPWPPERDAVD
ncbi:MAG: hypothetical protein QM831_44720 [Kofleriaceae bacterium]